MQKLAGVPVKEIAQAAPQRPPFTTSNEIFFKTQALLWAIYGEPGSPVTVRFKDGEGQEKVAEILRGARDNGYELYPEFPPVYLEHASSLLPGGIHYLSFNAFQPGDPQQIISAIEEVDRNTGLLIDLRGNNGGSAAATLELLSRFTSQRLLAYRRVGRLEDEAILVAIVHRRRISNL